MLHSHLLSAHGSAAMSAEGLLGSSVCMSLFEGCHQVEQHHIFFDDLKSGARYQARRLLHV